MWLWSTLKISIYLFNINFCQPWEIQLSSFYSNKRTEEVEQSRSRSPFLCFPNYNWKIMKKTTKCFYFLKFLSATKRYLHLIIASQRNCGAKKVIKWKILITFSSFNRQQKYSRSKKHRHPRFGWTQFPREEIKFQVLGKHRYFVFWERATFETFSTRRTNEITTKKE